MNLYIYDEHHQEVRDGFILPEGKDISILLRIIPWLESNKILDEYKRLVIAKSYDYVLDKETKEYSVEFKGQIT